MARAKWQIERDAADKRAADAKAREREMHAELTRLGHLALWCAQSWECVYCSASGTLEMPIPGKKCGA